MKKTNKTFKLKTFIFVSFLISFSLVCAQSANVLEFIYPADGATVPAGELKVEIEAKDADGVKLVRLNLDGVKVGIDKTAPYEFSTKVSAGGHVLRAVLRDGKDNITRKDIKITAVSGPTPVPSATPVPTITPKPTVTATALPDDYLYFVGLKDGDVIRAGKRTIEIAAADPQGVKLVRFILDNVNLGIDTTEPYTWDVDLAAGDHVLKAVKQDMKGNITRMTIKITAKNIITPTPEPTLPPAVEEFKKKLQEAVGWPYMVDIEPSLLKIYPPRYNVRVYWNIYTLVPVRTGTMEECSFQIHEPLNSVEPKDKVVILPGTIRVRCFGIKPDPNGKILYQGMYKWLQIKNPIIIENYQVIGAMTRIIVLKVSDDSRTIIFEDEYERKWIIYEKEGKVFLEPYTEPTPSATPTPSPTPTPIPSPTLTPADVLYFKGLKDGDTVAAGKRVIEIIAYDPQGVKLCRFILDGVNQGADRTRPYTWDVNLAAGPHVLRAVKEDMKGNITRMTIKITAKKVVLPTPTPPYEIISDTGTVIWLSFEGGFFGIKGDSGQNYDPINLPPAYQKDGLRVKFTAYVRDDLVSFHMFGIIIEIISISLLPEPKPTPVITPVP